MKFAHILVEHIGNIFNLFLALLWRLKTSFRLKFRGHFDKMAIFQFLVDHFQHSHKKRKDSLETRGEPAVLCVYVENQAILEPILLYRASKCKQAKEQGSEDCLWTYIFTFLRDYYTFFSFFCQNANIAGSNCAIIGCYLAKKHKLALPQTWSKEPNYIDHKILLWYLLGANCKKNWEIISKYYRAS